LDRPGKIPENICVLMEECWDIDPDMRPPFSEIVKILKQELDSLKQSEYVKINYSMPFDTPPDINNSAPPDTSYSKSPFLNE